MGDAMTIRQLIQAIAEESITQAEKRGFVLRLEEREIISRRVASHYLTYRKNDALDTFTTKEDPKLLVQQTLERNMGRGGVSLAISFDTEENLSHEFAVSQIGARLATMLINAILGGETKEFSHIHEDMDRLLKFIEMRKLQGDLASLRPEDLGELSATISKTLIDVEACFQQNRIQVGHYL